MKVKARAKLGWKTHHSNTTKCHVATSTPFKNEQIIAPFGLAYAVA
jgi:hypothetical protein